MPPKKELSKHQLSHRLQFQSHTPNFLRAFQAQVSGFRASGPGDEDEDSPQYANGDEFAQPEKGGGGGNEPGVDEFGREIRRTSEERTMVDPRGGGGKGSLRRDRDDHEEEGEEAPLVVVIKEGKHLSALEAENERRRVRGLSPLPDLDQEGAAEASPEGGPASTSQTTTTSRSHAPPGQNQSKTSKSGVQLGAKAGGTKRKVPLGGRDDEQSEDGPANKRLRGTVEGMGGQKKEKKQEKGKKKAVKGLLSFGDDG